MLSGRPYLAVGGLIGGIGIAVYFAIIQPYMNPGMWQEKQKIGRAGIDREKIQPGGMKVWTDPFDRTKDQGK
ncbi:hypothetical protein SNE40_016986 [Patella caerulea]|uniref:Small integral membrane protein 20 n=1 Tax=Patella caerulea TaxID=87958 RepID=A0AAN8JB17_PATCE